MGKFMCFEMESWVDSCVPKKKAVPAPLEAPLVVLLLNDHTII